MATIRKLIEASLRKIGVLAGGETLSADEAQDALLTLQLMLSGWSNEVLIIPVVGVVRHDLVVGESEYTIGIYPAPVPDPLPETHIETARPMHFLTAILRDASGTDYDLSIMDAQRYNEISRKSNSSRPSRIYIREGWPLSTIIFESLPYDNETLIMEVRQPLSGLIAAASLDDVVTLPEGYDRAIVYNLALELASEYQQNPSNLVAGIANRSLKFIKNQNSQPLILGMDRALVSQNRGNGTYQITQGP